jgi:hypothetical protein
VTFFRKPRPLTPAEEVERDEALRYDYLQGLFESFVLTGDKIKLAEFIREGGDLDKFDLREMVADLVIAEPEKNPGGARDATNILFYLDVEARRRTFRPKTSNDTSDKTLHEKFDNLKPVGKTAAIEELSKKQNIEATSGWGRYRKGKKLFEKRVAVTSN